MTAMTSEPTMVPSADGTQIAVFVSGRGRPLVVVPGTTSDHTTWSPLAHLFDDAVSVHAMDRRGRGASGDHPVYTIEKEYADVAAVVDAAAATWGRPVDLLGHSFGGTVAFGAALRTAHIRRLVLYEGWPVPDLAHRTIAPAVMAVLESSLAEHRPEELLETLYRDVVHLTDAEIAGVKSSAAWRSRVAAAPTVPRELRAFSETTFDATLAARIRVPVLLIVGEVSPADIKADPDVVVAALPDARIATLAGQAHVAHLSDPEGFATVVLSFLTDRA
ncbi:MAG: alpha/beta hydrolase [Dermatophilaceae bacterium]